MKNAGISIKSAKYRMTNLDYFCIVFKEDAEIKDDSNNKQFFRAGDKAVLTTCHVWKSVELCAKGIAEPFIESEEIHNAIMQVKKNLEASAKLEAEKENQNA